VLLVHK